MARKAVDGITIAINLMYCYGTNEISIIAYFFLL